MLDEPKSDSPRRRPPHGIYAYTAREWDPEIGLYYYRARHYDPKIGRFVSEDPIGFLAGSNFYSYVGNEPVNSVDPSGLKRTSPRRPQQRLPTPKLPCRLSLRQRIEQFREALEGDQLPLECIDPCNCYFWYFNEEECRWELKHLRPDHCIPILDPCEDKKPCKACL